jgi:HEAT repeat protein
VRFRAGSALAHIHDPRAYEAILSLTDDPVEGVRSGATVSLGILGDERAIEPLTRMLLSKDGTRPADMAFSHMGLMAVPAMIELLQVNDPDVRSDVICVLGDFALRFRDARSIELLQAHANDPDPRVGENARDWLNEYANLKPNTA